MSELKTSQKPTVGWREAKNILPTLEFKSRPLVVATSVAVEHGVVTPRMTAGNLKIDCVDLGCIFGWVPFLQPL